MHCIFPIHANQFVRDVYCGSRVYSDFRLFNVLLMLSENTILSLSVGVI